MLVKWKHESWLIWVGIGLYAFEVFSRLLSASSLGFHIPFNARYGPFFGTIFFAVGWRLSSRQRAFGLKPAIALLSGGFAILVVDTLLVRNPFGSFVLEPFLETTVGIGSALLALACPALGDDTILASLGQYTLGIYVIHPLFIDFSLPFAYLIPSHVRDLAFPAMIFLFSALTAMILQKIKVLSPFVAASRPIGPKAKNYQLPGSARPINSVTRPETISYRVQEHQ
jgi:surface polysaccharide O-acyltransferase-like enzyme